MKGLVPFHQRKYACAIFSLILFLVYTLKINCKETSYTLFTHLIHIHRVVEKALEGLLVVITGSHP